MARGEHAYQKEARNESQGRGRLGHERDHTWRRSFTVGGTSVLRTCGKGSWLPRAVTGRSALSSGFNWSIRKCLCWDTRRQILSIMADIVSFHQLQRYLPGITEYRFKAARQHKLVFGRGVPLPPHRPARMRVDNSQLDHFLTFITSAHVMQDLPFGQRYLQLTTGNAQCSPYDDSGAHRQAIPAKCCDETEFKPFGRTAMLNILSACSATVRKSLQGLDYIAAEGSRAFEDLSNVIKRLEERGALSRNTTESLQRSLKTSKQYLKSDYKVSL